MSFRKKVMVVVMALAMALALSPATAFAASITMPTDTDHTYNVYQIMTGDISGKTISNAVWGSSVASGYTTGDAVSDTDLTTIESIDTSDEGTAARSIAKYVDFTKPVSQNQTSASTVTNLAAGYYLIQDVTNVSGQDDAVSLYMVAVAGDSTVTLNPKNSTPSVIKKVKDVDDSKSSNVSDWQDSADYDIGDPVPFQITATINATRFADYAKYKLVIHDTQSAGLTFDASSVKVMLGTTEIASSYYTVNTPPADGHTFDIVFDDLKQVEGVGNGSKITVTYNATLNSNAAIGSAGNPNTVYLEYSNNPNQTFDDESETPETGKTTEDKVIVFTYKLVVNKVNENNEALTGATFKLEKKIATSTTEYTWKEVGVVSGTSSSTFTWSGLDDGDYRISETVTPSGYNTMAAKTFSIGAEHETQSDNPTLKSLTCGLDVYTSDLSAGSITTTIQNNKGNTLPETGAAGTTMLMVIGGILVVGAGVLLVTRRKMNACEE